MKYELLLILLSGCVDMDTGPLKNGLIYCTVRKNSKDTCSDICPEVSRIIQESDNKITYVITCELPKKTKENQ